jgi:hypothetical protein
MGDLISRAAAIEEIARRDTTNGTVKVYSGLEVNAILSDLPAVDAVLVVHARWTTERTWKHDGEWYCSACEYEPVVFIDTAFCPNCAAKMDGERRDGE